jgi:hypothetical protein
LFPYGKVDTASPVARLVRTVVITGPGLLDTSKIATTSALFDPFSALTNRRTIRPWPRGTAPGAILLCHRVNRPRHCATGIGRTGAPHCAVTGPAIPATIFLPVG